MPLASLRAQNSKVLLKYFHPEGNNHSCFWGALGAAGVLVGVEQGLWHPSGRVGSIVSLERQRHRAGDMP